jgi:hypothetical protein
MVSSLKLEGLKESLLTLTQTRSIANSIATSALAHDEMHAEVAIVALGMGGTPNAIVVWPKGKRARVGRQLPAISPRSGKRLWDQDQKDEVFGAHNGRNHKATY